MADDDYRSRDEIACIIRAGNLPYEIKAKDISACFERFGMIKNLYLKRRVSKNSNVYLAIPHVNLVFHEPEVVNRIMAARPLFIHGRELFIRRYLPNTPKYPYESSISVKKILVRTPLDENDEILPDDESIVEYLTSINGTIEYFERLDDKTVLVQFDDYDPVDVCCLLRPHFIKNQLVEIEKCSDEEQVRHRVESRQKLNSISTELSSISTAADIESRTMDTTTSPTPVLLVDDQMTQLRSTYNDVTSHLEREHEQLVASLSNEWKQTAKERVRLQRLTLDYKQDLERITIEKRKWQKLFSDSIKEKPIVQEEGEQKFQEVDQKYEQLVQNIPPTIN